MQLVLTEEIQDRVQNQIQTDIGRVKELYEKVTDQTIDYYMVLAELRTLSTIAGKFDTFGHFSLFNVLSVTFTFLEDFQQANSFTGPAHKLQKDAERHGASKALKFVVELILMEINRQDMVS
jgi:hypothetical protein